MSGWVLGGNKTDGFDEAFEHAGGCFYERLVRDDGLVLGCILSFEDGLTYAHAIGLKRGCFEETRVLGAFRSDQAARNAVERALEETSA